jgi:peroxiredoxin
VRRRTSIQFIAISILVAGILAVSGCATTTPTELTEATQYPKAPDPGFTHMDGSKTTLADYEGKSVLVVNFWGLRCQNCIEEMPFLERLHNKYGSKGLVLLGVNTDGVDETLLPKFMPQLPVKVSYPIVVDPEFALADAYQMMAAPLTIVIAKDGTIRYRHEGYEPSIEGKYIEIIEKLLSE